MSMTKRDFVVKIAEETGLVQKDVAAVVQMVFDGLANEIADGGNVELRNFGVFEVVTRKKRVGRNPNKPAAEVTIPARSVVKFRAGKELKARVEKLNPKKLGRKK